MASRLFSYRGASGLVEGSSEWSGKNFRSAIFELRFGQLEPAKLLVRLYRGGPEEASIGIRSILRSLRPRSCSDDRFSS